VTRKTNKIYWENIAEKMAAQTVDSAMDLHKQLNYGSAPAVELVLCASAIVDPDNYTAVNEGDAALVRNGAIQLVDFLEKLAPAIEAHSVRKGPGGLQTRTQASGVTKQKTMKINWEKVAEEVAAAFVDIAMAGVELDSKLGPAVLLVLTAVATVNPSNAVDEESAALARKGAIQLADFLEKAVPIVRRRGLQ
jgi:hypothetical protein